MGKYNLPDNFVVGDPGHVEQHAAVSDAVNDLDTRVDAKLSTIFSLLATLATTDPDLMTVNVAGVARMWLNEWGALRGRNPYTTWADSLARAVVQDGDNTAGNAFEINDRRTGAASPTLWGVNWGTGRVTQGGNNVGMVYVLNATQTAADIPATLPSGTLVVRKTS